MSPFERPIVASERIPDAPRRWLYRLTCGHVVTRRQSNSKRKVHCGYCEAQGVRIYA